MDFCGEGIPSWAIQLDAHTPAFPLPFREPYVLDNSTGLPTPEDCAKLSWSTYQFTAAAANGYQNLYNLGTRTNNGFNAFWGKVAQRFKNTTNVVGYELVSREKKLKKRVCKVLFSHLLTLFQFFFFVCFF